MAKILKIGWVLVREGVISQAQLENILEHQKKKPTRSVGEIAADLFGIPEEEIETIFADQILAEAVKGWFFEEIGRRMAGLPIERLITAIEVEINGYTRNIISQKDFTRTRDNRFHPDRDRRFLSTISSTIKKLTIKTAFKEEIVFQEFKITFDMQSRTVSVENEALVIEARIKLNRLLKRQAGGA